MKKTKTATLALILTLTIAISLIAGLPVINAQVTTLDIYLYISVSPNPVGAGDEVMVVVWTDKMPPETPADLAVGPREAGWNDITVTVKKPDGSQQNLGPYKSDPIGSLWFKYTPDRTGVFSFQGNFPGEWKNFTERQHYYNPATSEEAELTVQQEGIEPWPPAELPTDYWERPIDAQNREWTKIAGNWLGVQTMFGKGYDEKGCFNPYTTAPDSAHIVWTKPIQFGGIVGGEHGEISYYTGLSYEAYEGRPPIIIQGRLYYQLKAGRSAYKGTECLDLRTGETIWFQEGMQVSLGQLYNYDSPNQHGVLPYLWRTGSTYKMYDAFTGDWILDMENASTGRIVYSPKGDMLVYILNGRNNWLAMWNSSKVEGLVQGTTGAAIWSWRPRQGATLDWRTGIEWNVTVPEVPSDPVAGARTQSISRLNSEVIVAAATAGPQKVSLIGYDATDGHRLWIFNMTSGAFERPGYFVSPIVDGKFAWFKQETREWTGFNAITGDQIWGPTKLTGTDWAMFSSSVAGLGAIEPNIAYGKLYSQHYDGRLYATDMQTGEISWDYHAGSSGYETPYGDYPLAGGLFAVADGKVFATPGEHSPSMPLWRGARLHAVNADNGDPVWSIMGWMQTPIIADGYLVAFNNYDGQLYCIGKGKTATTVTVQDDVLSLGETVLIKGMVTDQSPGAKDTPAIADEHMSEWMEYLYMDQPMPTDATGVPVTIDAIDPNGDYISIGTTTSDMSGFYSLMWEPEDEGKYTIVATFEGSDSYFASYAENAVGVTEAVAVGAQGPPGPQGETGPMGPEGPAADAGNAVMIAAGAIIVALVAIVLAAYLFLKKRS